MIAPDKTLVRLGGAGDDNVSFFYAEDVMLTEVDDHGEDGYVVLIKLRGGHTLRWSQDKTLDDLEETLNLIYNGHFHQEVLNAGADDKEVEGN